MTLLNVDSMVAERDLPRRSKARRRFLAKHLDVAVNKTLEIGALNVPTLTPSDCDARFLDWFSTDELRSRHESNPVVPPDSIVSIDYVISDRNFAERIDVRFDLVIANHVIEHIPDLVHWLNQIASLTADRGRLLLSVPDRRYTFDYHRPEDDAVDVFRAHSEGLVQPSRFQIAKHLYYFTDFDHVAAWAGEKPTEFVPRMSFSEALSRSADLARSYTDVHCWVFTETSFARVISALGDSGHIAWEIEAIEPVLPDENEFRALLRRRLPTS